MVNVLIAILYSVLSFCIFKFSNQITCVNRIVTHIPIQVFELSVDLINSDEHQLYFDQREVKSNVDKFLKKEISVYVDEFTTTFTFLNNDQQTINTNGKSSVVKIDFVSRLDFNYKFERSMIYEIWSRNKQ